jgi:hypothetical protein
MLLVTNSVVFRDISHNIEFMITTDVRTSNPAGVLFVFAVHKYFNFTAVPSPLDW